MDNAHGGMMSKGCLNWNRIVKQFETFFSASFTGDKKVNYFYFKSKNLIHDNINNFTGSFGQFIW